MVVEEDTKVVVEAARGRAEEVEVAKGRAVVDTKVVVEVGTTVVVAMVVAGPGRAALQVEAATTKVVDHKVEEAAEVAVADAVGVTEAGGAEVVVAGAWLLMRLSTSSHRPRHTSRRLFARSLS